MSAALLIFSHPDHKFLPAAIAIQSFAGDVVFDTDDPAAAASAWQALMVQIEHLPEPTGDTTILGRHFQRKCHHLDGRECRRECFPGTIYVLDLPAAVAADAIAYNICYGGHSPRPDIHARRAVQTYRQLAPNE